MSTAQQTNDSAFEAIFTLFPDFPKNKPLKTFTRSEVAQHNSASDVYIIVDGIVYNMTMFKALHPGGEGVIMQVAGKDATQEFYGLHRHSVLSKYANRLIVGVVQNETPKVEGTVAGSISKMPYAEQSFWRGFYSPYFDESHKRLRSELRQFVETKLFPEALELEESGNYWSKETWKAMAALEIHASRMGPGKHLKGRKLMAGIKPEDFNYFHEAIFHEELVRMMTTGANDGLGSGQIIGLPPLLNYGTAVHQPVIDEVLRGDKWICLAISEAVAGSDVAGIQTTAKLSDDGKHFIVNGTKKWITNGMQSDYFTTACRTGKGFTMMLIPRQEGLETKRIKTSYSTSAGTAYITYDDVKVPVENVLGKVDKGFAVIMSNFNHERWTIAISTVQMCRSVIAECFKWAKLRKVAGKSLLEMPQIRAMLAEMIAATEACQTWCYEITHQMNKMSYAEQAEKLAGPIALLKYQCTRTANLCADKSVQIFGGRGITKTGMGRVIETFQRTNKFSAILGGSEEVMQDLAIRQGMRNMPNEVL